MMIHEDQSYLLHAAAVYLPRLVLVHAPIVVDKRLIHVTFTAHVGRRSGAAVGVESCVGRR